MKAVIMAGGKGTRIKSLTNDVIPKPMLPILDAPILEHQINRFRENGVCDIIIIAGHLSHIIQDYFEDGEKFGVNIEYILEQKPLGTAGAFFYLKDMVDDDFVLMYGDVVFDICFDKMYGFHKQKNSIATLFVHPNSHPYDSDIVVLDEKSKVVSFDSKNNVRDYNYHNCINSGAYIFSKDILDLFDCEKKVDLEKDILFRLAEENADIYGYESSEYIKDVGTPDRIKKAELDISREIVSSKNLSKKQKCIFLDRDGTLNKHIGLLYKKEDLQLLDGAVDAVKKINESKYLCIVITNQPVVARGLCEISDVYEINMKLETLLGNRGAYIDKIEFCPHHPDKGYPEENKDYKIDCDCRKPKTGMVDRLDIDIDFQNSWFVGDTTVDIKTGENLGVKTILLETGEGGNDKKYVVNPTYTCDNILGAVNIIINNEGEMIDV